MGMDTGEDAKIELYTADERGRITLGKEYANSRVRVVLERIGEESSIVPDSLPRFDYQEVGLSPDADGAAKRAALAKNEEAGGPYWVGTTVADNTEVGIDPATFKQHIMITGMVDTERQAAVRSQYQQALAHGTGALVYDHYTPLAADGDESPYRAIAREVGREDDVIEIDVEDAESAGFNYIEIGGETLSEPDTERAAEQIGEIVDEIKSLVTLGGGEYWGPRMDRGLRQVIYSAARAGVNPTLRDVYDVLSGSRSRSTDEAALSDRRDAWLAEACEGKEQTESAEWEPLCDRLELWIAATAVRRAIANPNPTFSIEEAVADGKIILITGNSAGRETTQIGIAAMLRAWNVQRTIHSRPADSPPFTLIADGFHILANTHHRVADLVSRSRASDFSIVASAPSLNLFDNADEIVGNVPNHLTFATTEQDAQKVVAYHSRNVTQQAIQDLGENQAYLRTSDADGNRVESIKIKSLTPSIW